MALRILNLAHKEFVQFFRDRQLSAFTFVGPTLMLIMVAGITSSHVAALPMAVVDLDRSAESRNLITLLRSIETLHHVMTLDSPSGAQRALDAGEVVVVVTIPPDFSSALNHPHRTAQVQLWTDGVNLIAAFRARLAAQEAIRRFGAHMVYRRWPGREPKSPVDLRTSIRFNPELDSSYNAIPAQLSQVVYLVALIISSTSISKERERGTMEQLMVTPLQRFELILGKALPVVAITLVDFVTLLAATIWMYDVPMRGSFWALLLLTLLFVSVEMWWGMMISAVSRTQQQSLLMVFMLGMFDMAFSGYLVAVENMPLALQWVSNVVPLRYYMEGVRAVMIKGGGLEVIWRQCAAIALLNAIVLPLAAVSLRRRLD
jgi:ABC-2 type transport system permease protein